MEANVVKDQRAPSTLRKVTLYANWKKEIRTWEAFTSVPEKKHAPVIFMKLMREARETILNMEIEALTAKTTVKNM